MIEIKIPKKITDDHLLSGEKIKIQYFTEFNQMMVEKIFPDDFTLEEQEVFKNVYEDAVYGSEVGKKIFRCTNLGKAITITGYKRTEPTEIGIVDFDSTQPIRLNFTRHGLTNRSIEISAHFSEEFSPEDIASLEEIGISVSGIVNEFQVVEFDGDISIEVIKGETDSFIDLGDFKNGKLILQK